MMSIRPSVIPQKVGQEKCMTIIFNDRHNILGAVDTSQKVVNVILMYDAVHDYSHHVDGIIIS